MNDIDPSLPQPGSSICPACGQPFICGMLAGDKACWCAQMPPLLGVSGASPAACYCPACLRHMLDRQAAEDDQ